MDNQNYCYCGSNKSYSDCCQEIIEQTKIAETPEQLMRSRFSAFTLKNSSWLKNSWHTTTRPKQINFEDNINWLDLSIINTQLIELNRGRVEFEARYLKNGKINAIHENSRFEKIAKQWFYIDGDYLKQSFKTIKVKRNDPCPCLSGKKFKICCENN